MMHILISYVFKKLLKLFFSVNELSSLAGADNFMWKSLSANGHLDAILIGAKLDVFDFVSFDSSN